MSGEQEPWVFRGGLTADLQVCGNTARAQVAYLLGLDFPLLYLEKYAPVVCVCFPNA